MDAQPAPCLSPVLNSSYSWPVSLLAQVACSVERPRLFIPEASFWLSCSFQALAAVLVHLSLKLGRITSNALFFASAENQQPWFTVTHPELTPCMNLARLLSSSSNWPHSPSCSHRGNTGAWTTCSCRSHVLILSVPLPFYDGPLLGPPALVTGWICLMKPSS